jgi:hypothetical protein
MSVRLGHEVSEVGGGHRFSGWVNEVEAEGLIRWMRRGFPRLFREGILCVQCDPGP